MYFSLVFHNHQPIGQLPWAFEDAWRESYAPFLNVLEKHPAIPVALHYTGPLLDWLVENKPQTFAQIRKLRERGQIEILGGGYYEPILAVWPRRDQEAQLRKLSARVTELFGPKPRGVWLAERVWEPQLAGVLRACDAGFTFVDGTVFEAAGIDEEESRGYFEAKFDGESTPVFPINQPIRHIVPWHEVEEIIAHLQAVNERAQPHDLVVFADDGEKFGAWPGTHEWIFEQGWLDQFLTALEENADWLTTILPGEYSAANPPRGKLELPGGSYGEMQDWSGGNWRNFLERYTESGDMYREVLRASHAIADNATALDAVLQAQSNDAYWHGVFGGLYLRHLRQAVYGAAAQARVLHDGAQPFARAGEDDSAVWIENERQKLLWRNARGHAFGWISKAARHNTLATLRRYEEKYHSTSTADWHERGALLDHFFDSNATPELFATSSQAELGDFISEDWDVSTDASEQSTALTARRAGGVWCNGEFRALTIAKQIHLTAGGDELNVEYTFLNPSDQPLEFWWGCEWNFTLTGNDLPDRHYHEEEGRPRRALDEIAQFESVRQPIIGDRWRELWIEWDWPEAVGLWHIPLYTVSQKEGGEIETMYQQSAFVFHRRFRLAPREEYSFAFKTILTAKREL